jgi:hypothetical protein
MPPARTRKKGKTRPVIRAKKQKKQTAAQEIGFIGKALRGLGGLGGSTLGALIGQQSAGASIGNSLGASISKWLGAGDYEVSSNSIVARASATIPMMHKTGQSVMVRHREYIGPISGTTAFNVAYSLTVNPGISATFPWLSIIAQGFQEYNMKGMVYHYVPTSGMAISGTNSALGSVMMQTSYRSDDTAPTSKIQMLNEYWANEVVPSETMCHPIECDPRENPFSIHYVRTGNIPSGEPLLYDLGTTFVCTQGMQGTNQVGDLWVTYEVELKKPIVASSVTTLGGYYSSRFSGGTNSALFAGAQSAISGNMPLTFTGNTITLPIGLTGQFVMFFYVVSSGGLTNTTGNPWTGNPTLTNCALAVLMGADAVWIAQNASATVVYNQVVYATSIIKVDPSTAATVVLPATVFNSGTFTYVECSIANLGLS